MADRATERTDAGTGAPRRVRIDLSYRGSGFYGFSASPGVRTVEATLVEALESVLRHPVSLAVAGRTDKGVHARGQVASFDTTADHFDPTKLRSALNKICKPDIAVSSVQVCEPSFHARHSATGRCYTYRLHVAEIPDPLRADQVWWVPPPVSIEVLNACADSVVGGHDFSGFCRRQKNRPEASMIRRVRSAQWVGVGDELRFSIEANAFCHQMVRSIVGTSVEMARGRLELDIVERLLETGDRSLAPELAAPGGLTLDRVLY